MHRTATRRLDSHRGRLRSTRRASGTGVLLQPVQNPPAAATCPLPPGLAHGYLSSSTAGYGVDPFPVFSSLDTTWLDTAGPPWLGQPCSSPFGAWSTSAWGSEDQPCLALAGGVSLEPPTTPSMSARPYNAPQQQQQQQQQQSGVLLQQPPAAAPQCGLHNAAAQAWQQEASSSVRSSLELYHSTSSSTTGSSRGWQNSLGGSQTSSVQSWGMASTSGHPHITTPASLTRSPPAAAAAARPACVCCYPPSLVAGLPCEVRMYLSGLPGTPSAAGAAAPPLPAAAMLQPSSVFMMPYHVAMWQGGCLVTEFTGGCCSDTTMIRLSVPPLREGPLTLQLQLNSSGLITQQLLVLPEAAAEDLTHHWAKLVQQALGNSDASTISSSGMGLPACASPRMNNSASSCKAGGAAWSQLGAPEAPTGAAAAAASAAQSSQQGPYAWQQWLEGAGQLQPAAVQTAWHEQYMPLVNNIATVATWCPVTSHTTTTCSSSSSTDPHKANPGQQIVLTEPRHLLLLAAVVEAMTAAGLWALLQHVTDCVYGAGAAAKALYSATSTTKSAAGGAAADAAAGMEEMPKGKQAVSADDENNNWSSKTVKISAAVAEDCQSVQPLSVENSTQPSSTRSISGSLSVRTPSEASSIIYMQVSGSQTSLYPPSCSSRDSSLVGSGGSLSDPLSGSILPPVLVAGSTSSRGSDRVPDQMAVSGVASTDGTHAASNEPPLLPPMEGAGSSGSSHCIPPAAAYAPSMHSVHMSTAMDMSAAVVRVLCLLGVLAAVAWMGGAP